MNVGLVSKTVRIFPIILLFFAIPMILGGAQLIILGGSFYYLLSGFLLAACAGRLWKQDPAAPKIYGALMIFTVLWSLNESGTNHWALLPRILPFAVLGLWFLTPWLRRSLHQGNPPALFAAKYPLYATVIGLALTAYVAIDGAGYEVNPLTERSGVNTVNTATDWPS